MTTLQRRLSPATDALLLSGFAGSVLWAVIAVGAGAVRPGYDPVRHYVSQLALGPGGWLQALCFLLTGASMIAFAFGVRRVLAPGRGAAAAPVLLAAFGLGLVIAGIFPADPGLNGYPPGTTVPPNSPTPDFQVHILSAVVVFCALPGACLVLARRFRRDPAWSGWALYSLITGIIVWVMWAGSTILSGDGSAPIDAVAGLVQRVYLALTFGWTALLALRLHRVPVRSD